MKKKIICICLIVAILIIAVFGVLYVVDQYRMKNNKPVLFSTWGYCYAPPAEPNTNADIPVKQSFVATVLEETTTYMIVEPVQEKPDMFVGDKVKVEYGTDHYDYLYGIGRKVVIYYKGTPEETSDGMKLIKSDDISTEGFCEFELLVEPSDEKIKRMIIERTDPTDSSGKWWTYGDAGLYYYGVDKVLVTINGWTMPLEKALEEGRITLNGIISNCNQDVQNGVIEELVYKDGGSQIYKYPQYTIIKYHTIDGNRDVYIGSTDMNIDIANKIKENI